MEKEQKVVLVTGASIGIGEATALEFAKLGHRVAITGRCEQRLAQVLARLKDVSPLSKEANEEHFLAIQADFEHPDQVEPVVSRTVDKFKRLDILVNNAGYPGRALRFNNPEFFDDFQNVLQVNLLAATRIAQLAMPHLLESRGVIINVSSIADRLASPSVSYCVSKAGLSMLTKTLANAVDGKGVRVVSVCPGPIQTNFSSNLSDYAPMTSLQRVGEPHEVAHTIVFLASDKASFIHGCSIDVDGGCLTKHGNIFGQVRGPRD